MKKYFFLILFVVGGCKTTSPSEAITNNAVGSLNGLTEEVSRLEDGLPIDCKNVAVGQFKTIYGQIENIRGQVKNISMSCQTEKKVLEKEVEVRNMIIIFMICLFGFITFIFARRK